MPCRLKFVWGDSKIKENIMFTPKRTSLILRQLGRVAIAFAPVLGLSIGFVIATTAPAYAHPGPEHHADIMTQPIAGVRNNFWYDYKSDVEEAESELASDLRRADTAQDRREAWAEYKQELRDARKDYRKEMIERGYVKRGEVTLID
jgi:hypothetical protein